MADDPPHYCIDTSALITWWDEDYSPDVFEGLPDKLAGLIDEGRLRTVRYVREEIKDADDEVTLAKWCKAQDGFYLDDDEEIQVKVKELMAQFQTPKKKFGIGGADPFVIARAVLNGPHWHVVSSENPYIGNEHKNPNIPFVCKAIGTEHIRFLDLLRMEGWKLK